LAVVGDKHEAEAIGGDQTEDEVQEATSEPTEEVIPTTTLSGQMKVHFINVGQGDAILIQTVSQNILIDGGERGPTVVNYLNGQGVKNLDLVIGIHPHADHLGGLIDVLEVFPVKEVIDPAVVHTTKTFEDYLTLIDKKDIIFTEGRTGMSRDLGGGARMEILHPVSPQSEHLNDASIVVKILFGQISFMMTGDAEQASEEQILLQSRVQPTSTILKVGHHGSRTSTTPAFLSAVSPKVAVIMCGRGNTYGHPHDETLAKLADAKVDIYRTD
jgi:competence protein ComEC